MMRLALLVLATLVACRPPARLVGEFSKTTIADAQQGGHEGEQVRWGVVIISTTPANDRTCMEILSFPLDRRARPRFVDASLGRFIACAPGFYDPKVFVVDRQVTVVGTLTTPSRGKVGDYDYPYPRVDAETIFLWPERRPAYYYGPYPYGYSYPSSPYPYSYPYPYLYPYLYPYWSPYLYWGGGHHGYGGGHHR